jgi:hypothetical protein
VNTEKDADRNRESIRQPSTPIPVDPAKTWHRHVDGGTHGMGSSEQMFSCFRFPIGLAGVSGTGLQHWLCCAGEISLH